MEDSKHPHQVLLQELREEFASILVEATQGIYIYMDDPHWFTNDRMAIILGYSSAAELAEAAARHTILDALVSQESQQRVVNGYVDAAERKTATTIPVTWKTKDGGKLKSQTTFVPICFKGNLLVLHFITPTM